MKIGDIVVSTAGHDMGELFFVQDTLGEYAFLIDGKCRPYDKPKKKKLKHIVRIGNVEDDMVEKILSNVHNADAEVRKQLKVFKKEFKENVCQSKM